MVPLQWTQMHSTPYNCLGTLHFMYFYILFWLSDHCACKSCVYIIVSLLDDSIFRMTWRNHICNVYARARNYCNGRTYSCQFSLCSLQMQTQRTSDILLTTLVTCWRRFPAVSAKQRFHSKLITVITFEVRIFCSIPTLILFPALSAFCLYLTLAFKEFVALARAVTDRQTDTHTHTHTMITRTLPPHGRG